MVVNRRLMAERSLAFKVALSKLSARQAALPAPTAREA